MTSKETNTTLKPLVIAIISSFMLISCDNYNEYTGEAVNPSTQTTSKILAKNSLKKAGSPQAFSDYIAQGMSEPEMTSAMMAKPMMAVSAKMEFSSMVSADAVSAESSRANPDLISSTNLIEKGVDELDFVKQDAGHIFTTSIQDKIIKVFNKPNTTPIASLEIPNFQSFKGLYLKQNALFSLQQQSYQGYGYSQPFESSNEEGEQQPNETGIKHGVMSLNVIDINNPQAPSIRKTYQWQGNYETSKRIGDNLYVVSQTDLKKPRYCHMSPPRFAHPSISDAIAVESMPNDCGKTESLTPESIAKRMPKDINGRQIDVSSCYIPNTYNNDKQQINGNITLITKVDLSGKENHSTTCVASSVNHVYMSPKSLYLTNQDYKKVEKNAYRYETLTNISKFSLTDGVTYAGTGTIDGQLGWQTKSFNMSEYKDVLRVFSVDSDWQNRDDQIHNMLHTLKESADTLTLETLATIPNGKQPTKIGKPNERIEGVRFLGDEAYVVTFERTDPLYKIDLSNPLQPKILGELEMPGYSAYLHRINDQYLLGVGYTVDDRGQTTGIQTTVFDTSSDDPMIIDQDSLVLKDNNDDRFRLHVANDSRAITTLKDRTHLRVAIPYTKLTQSHKTASIFRNNAFEYNINLITGKIDSKNNRSLIEPIELAPYPNRNDESVTDEQIQHHRNEQSRAYGIYEYTGQRALIDNDDLYYNMFNGDLVKHQWQQ